MVGLLQGKKGLVIGVANERSIAWGISRVLSKHGADLAFTYQAGGFEKRVRPLGESVGSNLIFQADVQNKKSLDFVFEQIEKEWSGLDFLIHAIAYSDKEELSGRFINTSKENFIQSLEVSCFSLVDLSKRAVPLMKKGGAITTVTYMGSQ